MGEHFKDYKTIEKIEIQPYHKLGIHKWEALGWEYQLKDARENTQEEIEEASAILAKYFKEVKIN
jgi:pyruvate formate lyase activating enzyme